MPIQNTWVFKVLPLLGSKHLKPRFTVDSPFYRYHRAIKQHLFINGVTLYHCARLMVKWAASRPYFIEGVLLQTPCKHYANSSALLPQKRTDAHRESDGASVFLVFLTSNITGLICLVALQALRLCAAKRKGFCTGRSFCSRTDSPRSRCPRPKSSWRGTILCRFGP